MILSFDHTTSLTIMKIDIYWSERVYAGRGGPLLESPGNLTYPEQYFNIKNFKKRETGSSTQRSLFCFFK